MPTKRARGDDVEDDDDVEESTAAGQRAPSRLAMTKAERDQLKPINKLIRQLSSELSREKTRVWDTLWTWQRRTPKGEEATRAWRAAIDEYEAYAHAKSNVENLGRLAAQYGVAVGAAASAEASLKVMAELGIDYIERLVASAYNPPPVTADELRRNINDSTEAADKLLHKMRFTKKAVEDAPAWLATHSEPLTQSEWMEKALAESEDDSREAQEARAVRVRVAEIEATLQAKRDEASAMRKAFRDAKKQKVSG